MTDFPYRKYSVDELLEEYEKLRNYQPDKTLRRKNIGYKCSNAFFQYERMNTPAGRRISNIDYWVKNKTNLIKYYKQLKDKRDIYGIIQFLNHSPAQFPLNISIDIYSRFKATKILDPFAGWGDRCLAAMAKNIDYTGIDSNKNLKVAYQEMNNFYPHESQIKFINKPVEKVVISDIDFDFVLTSPPFWDKRKVLNEKYSNMPYFEYEAFMDNVFIPTILNCAQKAKWSCYYIPIHMAKYVSKKIKIKWNKVLTYSSMGNKKYQEYNIYCLKKLDD